LNGACLLTLHAASPPISMQLRRRLYSCRKSLIEHS
jgi:hypothetical protein